ncbi:hypothetical protein BT63DRAFT_478470 [Microthyrium microscopicum]|uniref:Ecp2 effector protein domain-containing protein n=1 Tax=Microthyrium microscopicum TaxID=703497 RepID=A0A6A6UDC5_9PEZI|nr:hypothetical protein BT63DRAFT_478470 [Microthyrium microscopicum]
MKLFLVVSRLVAITPVIALALNRADSAGALTASKHIASRNTLPVPKDPYRHLGQMHHLPHVSGFDENCNAKVSATCNRKHNFGVLNRHYIVGVEKYCPTHHDTNCWNWEESLGLDGSKLKDAISDHWCLGTNFTFSAGFNTDNNAVEIAPSGYYWMATMQTPIGCGQGALRNRMDKAGIPE